MDRVKSAVIYTFGSSTSPRSSGKGKNSKSNKGDSKTTREFLEKEIISQQEKNEIKQLSLTSFADSDGQSYGTSESDNEIECSQQSGQETTTVDEPSYVSQECGQACLAVQEEDALSGDEICQQQSGQQEDSSVQQSTDVDVAITNIGEACYANRVVLSTNTQEVSQQSTVDAPEENAGFISTESVQEVEEESKVVRKTSVVSQESQKVSQSIEQTVEVFDEADAQIIEEVQAKTVDVSEQSQQKSVPEPIVSICRAAEPIVEEIVKKTTDSKKSQKSVDTVDDVIQQIDSSKWCGVQKVDTKQEITQSLTTKTTEIHQESCKESVVVEKRNNIKTETKRTVKVEMFLEAKSKFSDTIEEDSEVLITAKFVNPLSKPLTDGKFWIEADNLGKPYIFEIPHIDAGETVICRALIFPQTAGYEFIVARFMSREIKRIVGFTNIRVARAISDKSTSEKIVVVPKIDNQKVSGTKKM